MLWVPLNMGMSAAHCQGVVREFQCLESGHPVSATPSHCTFIVFVWYVGVRDSGSSALLLGVCYVRMVCSRLVKWLHVQAWCHQWLDHHEVLLHHRVLLEGRLVRRLPSLVCVTRVDDAVLSVTVFSTHPIPAFYFYLFCYFSTDVHSYVAKTQVKPAMHNVHEP